MKKVSLFAATALLAVGLAACGSSSSSSSSSSKSSSSSSAKTTKKVSITSGATLDSKTKSTNKGTLVMRQLYAKPHNSQSFAAVNVTLNGDTIVNAKIDEFQYVPKSSDWTGVPNSNADFGKSYPKGQFLIGKYQNSAPYSKLMKKEGKATNSWRDNMSSVENYVKGKTISQVKAAADKVKNTKKPSTVVSGSTFASTSGYLTAIYQAATTGMISTGVQTTDNNVTEGQVLGAPHGKQSFAITTVAMQNGKVASSFIDEFQYCPSKEFGGVPNSDSDFGKGIKKGTVLASKMANNASYSKLMKKEAKATNTWQKNIEAVNNFAKGKTIAQLEDAIGSLKGKTKGSDISDVVSGSTFASTAGYLQQIIDAAKQAK